MAIRPQLECVIGESGSGKTLYVSAIQLVNFLRDESGVFWHNLPLKADGLAKLSGRSIEEVESRLKLIPEAELKTWIDGKGGPWSFFADKNIKGAHIAIDEAHRYFGKRHSKEHLSKLGEWTGGLRHCGATCALITQHEFKLTTDARNEAGVQTRLFGPSQRTERFTGAKWHDVLQLLSKFWRRKIGLSIVREGVPQGRSARDFISDGFKYIFHKPAYYACYDSYNNIVAEGAHDGQDNRPKEEWERFGWLRLLVWYVERNPYSTGLRAGAAALLFWAVCLGGLSWAVDGLFQTAMAATGTLAGKPKLSSTAVSPSAAEPQPTPAKRDFDADSKIQTLAETNRQLSAKLMEAANYAEELTALVAVVGNSCYWADGSSGEAGSRVESGAFRGYTVESIDSAKGVVRLSGGIVLRVGVLSPQQSERVRSWSAVAASGGSQSPEQARRSDFGTSLSGGTPSPIAEPFNGVGQSGNHGAVQRYPDASLQQPARRSIRRLRGGGTSFGPADGNSGFSGNADPGGSLDGGSQPGRGAGGTSGPVLPGPTPAGGQGSTGPQESPLD